MPYTDAYGIWLAIATDYQPSTEWHLFNEQTQEKTLFRFTFNTNWDRWNNPLDGYRSYGLFRFHYHDDSGTFNLISEQRRIYPTIEPQLIEIEPIKALIDNPWYIRKMALKRKFFQTYKWLENHPSLDLKWTVKIELFLG